ncbi:MAG: FMN-binding protein [Spirochaetales bacterium]|nr:FMN-binding protein [Spirochaetales bacterium]
MNKNGLTYTILFSFVITFIFVFLLALANVSTLGIVEENAQVNEYRAILSAFGIEYNPLDNQDIIAKYGQIQKRESPEGPYYEATIDGETAYALPSTGSGLWGTIEVVMGVSGDLTRFTGLTVITHNETPGLGGRITESWFTDQYVGQRIPENGQLGMTSGDGAGDPNKDDDSIDAITGATRTSDSMKAIVASALARMKTIVGGNT